MTRTAPFTTHSLRSVALVTLLVCSGLVSGCNTFQGARHDPDAQLAQWTKRWEEVRADRPAAEAERDRSISRDVAALPTELDRLAAEFPNHLAILETAAQVSLERGDLIRAERYALRALQRDSQSVRARMVTVRVALTSGDIDLARREVELGLRLKPDDAQLHEVSAAVAYFDGRYDEATASLDRAAALGLDSASLHYHRGLIAETRGRVEDARRAYRRCLERDPEFERAKGRLDALR